VARLAAEARRSEVRRQRYKKAGSDPGHFVLSMMYVVIPGREFATKLTLSILRRASEPGISICL
jgi:hypothetical protein